MVSIIIPCFNAQTTIQNVLLSVIKQTYTNYEIIVIDDGSRDKTKEFVEYFFQDKQVIYQYIYQKNSGPSAARNNGIKNAKGEFIAFLDADDLWHPQKLELCMKVFEDEKIKALGHGYTLSTKMDKIDQNVSPKKLTFLNLLLKNFAVTPSVVIKKEIIELFNEEMNYAEDHELWLRISYKYPLYYLDLPLVTLSRKPLSKGGLSAQKLAMRKGEIKMYCKLFHYNKLFIFLTPFLVLFSLSKHLRNYLKGV
jgi:teichuronic acid biosynthesis glycosyltransferase TuaG